MCRERANDGCEYGNYKLEQSFPFFLVHFAVSGSFESEKKDGWGLEAAPLPFAASGTNPAAVSYPFGEIDN